MQRLRRVLCIGLIFVAGLAVACQSGPPSGVTPTTSPGLLLVFAKWVPDGNVKNGPEPGYKPAFTGLTAHDIKSASAVIDPSGTSWMVNVTFTSRGAALFTQLTRDNVAACSSSGGGISPASANCAQRHLAIWLGLTQKDIDDWEDPAYAAKVSQPFDLGCLANTTPTTICSKLVSDPVTLQEIDGGSLMIGGDFTQQSANKVADAINSTAKT